MATLDAATDPRSTDRLVSLLAILLQQTKDPVFLVDNANSVLDANQAFLDTVGVAKKQLIGKSSQDLFNLLQALGYDAETANAALDDGGNWEGDIAYKDQAGTPRTATVTSIKMADDAADASYCMTTIRDTTDARAAQVALGESEERLRAAMAGSLDGIFYLKAIKDENNKVIDFEYTAINDAGQRMMHFTRDEMLGHRLCDLVPETRTNGWLERYIGAYESGVAVELEFELNIPQVKANWLRHQIIPTNDGIALHNRDVGDDRRLRDQLHKNEESLQDLVEASSDVIWRTDADGRNVYISDRYAEITQQRAETLIGERIWETSMASGPQTGWEDIQRAIAAREPYRNLLLADQLDNGAVVHWSASGRPTYGDDGTFTGYHGTSLDVTDRVLAETRVRVSEERLKDIIEVSSDFTWETNALGEMTYVSEQLTEITGQTTESVLGSTPWEVGYAAPDSSGWEDIEAAFKAEAPYRDIQCSLTYDDGSKRYWSLSGTPAYDAQGTLIGFRGNTRDVTQRVNAERLAARNARMMNGIRDNVAVGLATIDIDGRIESFNSAAQQIFGYSLEEVLGRNINMLMPRHYAEKHYSFVSDYLVSGASQIINKGIRELTGRRKDGTEFPMDLTVAEMTVDNTRTFIGSFLDTTEHKLTEEKLRQSQRMDAIGQLTGGVAHDFNNILMGMQLNLELLEPKLEGDAESQESVELLLRSINRAAQLTQQLLAFSRRQVLRPEAIDVNQCLGELVTLVGRTLEATIDVKTDFQDYLYLVNIDAGQLENAVLNLSLNARHAMRQGGTLTIRTENHTVLPNSSDTSVDITPGNYVVVSVKDTGVGISSDIQEHVFEPFFTTRDVGQGSGLGLSMVHGFVHQSGGHVVLESQEGVGTTVSLYFPQAAASE